MKQHIVTNLAEPVGLLWRDLQAEYTKKGSFFIAAPLSSTPLAVYDWVITNAEKFENWDKVKFVLMDEQLEGDAQKFRYVPPADAASYEGFAKEHLLIPLQEKTGIQIPVVKPNAKEIEKFTTEIDLLILALGVGGNYANVMAGTKEDVGWHITKLLPAFKKYHEDSSYKGSRFRDFGMSLGPQQVMQAKHVAVIVSGEKKKEVTKELLTFDSFHSNFPLSIIHHPQVNSRTDVFITEDLLDVDKKTTD